jgi:hypothetical protein
MQREIQDTPTLMGVPGRFLSSGLKRRRLPGLADRCPELIQERLADEENVRAVNVAALFFDGFEHVYHPKSTTNFQQILEGREFADNLHSPPCTKRIVIYAVNSIIIKRWWWIKGSINTL